MKQQKRTYEVIGLKDLLTPIIVNGEKKYVRFRCDRTHPVLKKFNGIIVTDDPELQEALENDKRHGKKWKRIKNFNFYING